MGFGASALETCSLPIITLPKALLSLLSLAVLAGAGYLLWRWFEGFDVLGADGVWRHSRGPSWWLYLASAMFGWSILGRFVVLLFIPGQSDGPREQRAGGRMVTAPDGASLRVETEGRNDGPTVILTHGWGLDSTAWWYTRHALGARFRLISWDLPGLGKSKAPPDGKLTIDRFAQALGAVIDAAGPGPIVLVGHSIGGMTTQTLWRACPAAASRIAGVVLVDTTYENPINTMWLSPLWRALRWPLIEPMCWLSIVLSPLMWLASWQGYLSGSNQVAMRLTGFGKYATRGQVDFTARLASKGSPAVQAKGNLAMFRWSAGEVLPTITAPVLVLAGSLDIVTLPSASRAIAEATPHAELRVIDGCGHMGFMERSNVYNDAIASFVDRVCPADVAPFEKPTPRSPDPVSPP